MSESLLQIGEVAKQAGVTIRTVRYYLQEGLIDYADRSQGGFYLFAPEAVEKVRFIGQLRDLGLPLAKLKEMAAMLRESGSGDLFYRNISAELSEQLRLAEQKIAEYQELKSELEAALARVAICRGCGAKPGPDTCGICPKAFEAGAPPKPLIAIS